MKNWIKLLIMLVCAVGLLLAATSCGNTSGSGHLNDGKIKAKLMCTYASVTEPIYTGDIVIRYIDPLFNVGDHVRILGIKYEVLSFEHPDYDYGLVLEHDSVMVFKGDTILAYCHRNQLDSLIDSDN